MPSPPTDTLQEAASLCLRNYLQSRVVDFPINSFHLLRLLIADRMNQPKDIPPHLKLNDGPKFESMLIQWAEKWEYGTIVIAKGDVTSGNQLIVTGAQITDSATASGSSRKRKRGEDGVQLSESAMQPKSVQRPYKHVEGANQGGTPNAQLSLAATIEGMSTVDREIFNLLSASTAKQRLIAEQVSLLLTQRLVRL